MCLELSNTSPAVAHVILRYKKKRKKDTLSLFLSPHSQMFSYLIENTYIITDFCHPTCYRALRSNLCWILWLTLDRQKIYSKVTIQCNIYMHF